MGKKKSRNYSERLLKAQLEANWDGRNKEEEEEEKEIDNHAAAAEEQPQEEKVVKEEEQEKKQDSNKNSNSDNNKPRDVPLKFTVDWEAEGYQFYNACHSASLACLSFSRSAIRHASLAERHESQQRQPLKVDANPLSSLLSWFQSKQVNEKEGEKEGESDPERAEEEVTRKEEHVVEEKHRLARVESEVCENMSSELDRVAEAAARDFDKQNVEDEREFEQQQLEEEKEEKEKKDKVSHQKNGESNDEEEEEEQQQQEQQEAEEKEEPKKHKMTAEDVKKRKEERAAKLQLLRNLQLQSKSFIAAARMCVHYASMAQVSSASALRQRELDTESAHLHPLPHGKLSYPHVQSEEERQVAEMRQKMKDELFLQQEEDDDDDEFLEKLTGTKVAWWRRFARRFRTVQGRQKAGKVVFYSLAAVVVLLLLTEEDE